MNFHQDFEPAPLKMERAFSRVVSTSDISQVGNMRRGKTMRAMQRQHNNFFYDRKNQQTDKTQVADFVFEEFQNNKKGGI